MGTIPYLAFIDYLFYMIKTQGGAGNKSEYFIHAIQNSVQMCHYEFTDLTPKQKFIL